MDEFDVVIAGAGPVGLFLACELGLAGCAVLGLEREAEPGSPWRADPLGMRGLSATSVEAFYRRGMLHPLLKASGVHDDPDANLDADEPSPPRSVGQFAGIVLDPAEVDVAALPFRLPNPAMDGVMTNLDAGPDRSTGLRTACTRHQLVTPHSRRPGCAWLHRQESSQKEGCEME
ncbi:FAD-dependent monooxygenase [Nocardia sp. NPDC005998]|uniref:FAD-dependent oxidoreductase n=1 Tax=Nocardia sp. NPDC005998 TaxID=3156894 RepID=UPI0033B56E14